ncbi:unnamed protein product [Caenorhabditis brenneri]
MPPTFPLLRLPIDERLAVLQQMEMSHLFTLSLISKRAKNLVKSADRRARYVLVSIQQKIRLRCSMFKRPNVQRLNVELAIWKTPNERRRKVNKPRYVTILKNSPDDTLIKCKKEEYEVKDWLEHLCQIFHRENHDLVVEQDGSRYDLNSVYENFKNPSFFGLSATGNTGYINRVLKMIIPKSSISLVFRIFENGRPPKHILIQNYNLFDCYGNEQLMNRTFPLNDLLCNNTREFSTSALGFSEKDINKFLKLWIHGSNPRLQQLVLFPVSFDYDVVLRGIQNFILRDDQEKVFKTVTEGDIVVEGGREIRRVDGAVGRIVIDNQLGYSFGVMPPTFPLLRLPNDERLAVLRQMEMSHLFTLSLISKRAKNLVKFANRRSRAVVVTIQQKIQFMCRMFPGPIGPKLRVELSIRETPNEPRKVKKPRYVTILENSPDDAQIKCTKEEYEAKDWLVHLCQIFHRKDHDLIIEQHGSRYNLDSVYENFKNPGHLSLSATGNAEYDDRVLKMIIPKSRISLDFRIFENGRPPKHILIQNYDSIACFSNFQQLTWTRSLDDLLCINSREISTNVSGFSENDINKFLKLWIHGSNPRLQRLLLFHARYSFGVMPATFPLLRLPIDERLAVLRQMETKQLFVLSLISKRAKILVTSANRKARAVIVSVDERVQFSCQMNQGTTRLYVELAIWKTPNERRRKVRKPRYVTILENSRNEKLIKCTKKEYEVKDWLDHLFQIFHQKDHSLTFGRHGSFNDLDFVYENFKNPYHLRLSGTGKPDYDYRVLKMIIPRSSISLNCRIFENGRPPKDTLIQNYDSFVCSKTFEQLSWTRPLDDLLCTNSREIEINLSGFSEKDINKFLKLWIRGNPENVFKVYTVLDGIVMTGARRIRRMDGTTAGICLFP